LRKRRYLFSEAFATIALAAYGMAAGDQSAKERALALFRLIVRYHEEPGRLEPKLHAETRRVKGLAMPMILIATAQQLRQAVDDPVCTEVIDRCIVEIERDFVKPEFACVLESVGPDGEFHDTLDGRIVCPGHSIEVAWLLLAEARHRGHDARLVALATRIIDWSLAIGWDEQYGGLVYFCDARRRPSAEYPHDMKLWWPHNEAIIGTLTAYQMTGDPRYARWHARVHDWAYTHFPDRHHGEWFGYLHRDGTVSTRLKGNQWKGPFHLPRMQWYCAARIAEMLEGRTT
jgi:N-acylglucosamine 2-epimerase